LPIAYLIGSKCTFSAGCLTDGSYFEPIGIMLVLFLWVFRFLSPQVSLNLRSSLIIASLASESLLMPTPERCDDLLVALNSRIRLSCKTMSIDHSLDKLTFIKVIMLQRFVHIPCLAYLFKLDKLILVSLKIGRVLGLDLLAIIKLYILSLGSLQVKPALRSLTQPRLTVSSSFGSGVLEGKWECVAYPFCLRD